MSSTEMNNEDAFRLKVIKKINDEIQGCKDKFKFILSDLLPPKRDRDTIEDFNELMEQGYISSGEVGLIRELLELMKRQDLLDSVLPDQRESTRFPVISRYRRMLISVGSFLEDADCRKLSDLYQAEEFGNAWQLMMHLEKKWELKDQNEDLKLFEKNLKKVGCDNAAPLVRDYLKDYPEIIDRAEKALSERYCRHCKIMKSLPWDTSKGVRDLKDIFINLDIVLEHGDHRAEFPFPEYFKMFDQMQCFDGDRYRILIRGIAGTGKTTILHRISLDWGESVRKKLLGQSDTSNGLNFAKKFKLLFFLEIRRIKKDQTLFEAVHTQLLLQGFSKDDVNLIEKYVQHEPSKVLFMFDGYDELKQNLDDDMYHSDLLNALRCEMFENVHMVVTTRPHRAKDFKKVHIFYKHFELKGFKRKDIEKYVGIYFKSNKKAGEELMKYIKELSFVESIAEIPIMTAIICFLWESKNYKTGLPKTPSRLYEHLFKFLVEKYERRNGKKDKRQRLDESMSSKQVLCKIGELGLHGLQTEKDMLIFNVDELDDLLQQRAISEACEIGIMHSLKENEVEDLFGVREEVEFFHKSGQEKCAAIYLASLLEKNESEEFSEHLDKVSSVQKALDMHLLLKFTCAESYRAAELIITKLGDIYKDYPEGMWTHFYKGDLTIDKIKEMQQFLELCIGCNYEADKDLKAQMQAIFPEKRVRLTGISNYTAMSLAHFLKSSASIYHVELLYLGVEDNTQVRALMDKIPSCRRHYTELVTDISSENNIAAKKHAENFKKLIPKESFLTKIPTEQMYGIYPMYETLTKWQAKEINLSIVFNAITENLKSLTISGLQIKGSDFESFVELLRRMTPLENLCLNSNNLEEKDLEGFSECIGRMSELKILTLSGNQVSDGFASILQQIQAGKLMNLEELWVEKCSLSPETLCEAIGSFDYTPHLRVLDIRLNEVNNAVMQTLSTKMNKLPFLENLNMTTNNVDSGGYDPFFRAIKQMHKMKRLHIADSTFSGTLLYHIATIISEVPNLEYLHASGKNVKDIRAIPKAIFARFIKDLPKLKELKELNLVIIRFEKENFLELINVCEQLPKISDLRISFDLVPSGIDRDNLPAFIKRC